MCTCNFWMIYEDIFIGFMYLLSVFMLMKNSVNCGSCPPAPFFPSMGTCHKSSGIDNLLMCPYLCVNTEEKLLSEIQLGHTVIQSMVWPNLNAIILSFGFFLSDILWVEVPKLFLIK